MTGSAGCAEHHQHGRHYAARCSTSTIRRTGAPGSLIRTAIISATIYDDLEPPASIRPRIGGSRSVSLNYYIDGPPLFGGARRRARRSTLRLRWRSGRLSTLANDRRRRPTTTSTGSSPTIRRADRHATRTNDAYAWTRPYNVNRTYAVNGLNQYTDAPAAPATFAYDANGNLTSDGIDTFIYDVENRLVGAAAQRRRR